MDKHSIFKWYAKNFARKKFIKFNLFLFHLSVRGLGVLNYYDFKLSGEEFFIKSFLKKYNLRTVLDVGANEGDYAKHFLNKEGCKIHCFEPNQETFKLLKSKHGNNDAVKLYNLGLSNEATETVIYDTQQSDGSRLATIYKDVIEDLFQKDIKESSILLKTLDEMIGELGVDSIDLLKIDTEGNEYKVLQGAKQTLKRDMIKVIHFEFNMMNVVSRVYLRDFIELLGNFNIYRLLPNELVAIDYSRPLTNELFAFQNIIAIRKDLDDQH